MFFFMEADSSGAIVLVLFLGLLVGGLCGGVPLTIGLVRGNKSMAWTGFAACLLTGAGCFPIAVIMSLIFTAIVGLTQPIDAKKRKKRRRRRERADDFLEEDHDEHQRRRDRYGDEDQDEDRPRRRSRDYEVVDEEDDRPRRRRVDDDRERRPSRRRNFDDEEDDRPRRPRRD